MESWFSIAEPEPVYDNERATAYWDVALYADTTLVKANRIHVTIIDELNKKVVVIEMSCMAGIKRGERH